MTVHTLFWRDDLFDSLDFSIIFLLLKRDWDSFRLIRWNKSAENKVTEDRIIGIRNAS